MEAVSQMGKRKKWQWIERWFELRWTFSWAWLLPISIVLVSLLLTRVTFHQAGPVLPSSSESSGPLLSSSLNATAPDYASSLRDDLERFLPLVGLLLTVSLVGQEWRWGTLVQVALRKPLRWLLLERLLYVLLYIALVTVIAVLVSVSMTKHPPGNGYLLWTWDTLLIVFPPTLLLIAVGLLLAHSTVNTIAGYMVPVSTWLANIIFAQVVVNVGNKNDALLYTLFGWSYRSSTFHPDDWLPGKLLLLLVALFLLLVQFPLLRQEARLIRNVEE
jgi:hypothetical protein